MSFESVDRQTGGRQLNNGTPPALLTLTLTLAHRITVLGRGGSEVKRIKIMIKSTIKSNEEPGGQSR